MRRKWSYSIQSVMILVFSLFIMGVVSLAVYTSYLYTLREMRNVSVDYMSQLISQVNRDIERYISYMEDVSEVVGSNATVLRWLNEEQNLSTSDRLVLEDSVNRQLSGIVNVRTDITNIAVFAPSGRALFDRRDKQLNRYIDYTATDWYTEALQRGGRTYISTSHVQNVVAGQYSWVVSISKAITSGSGRPLGVLLVDLNYSLINDLCRGADIGDRGYLFLADDEGNIIYHPQQQLIYARIKSEEVDSLLHRNTQVDVSGPEGDKLYISNHSQITGWTAVGVAYQDEVLRMRGEMVRTFFVIVLCFMLVALLFSAAISAAISRPLKRLAASMKEVQSSGDLDIAVQIDSPREVAQLSRNFSTMMDRIRRLMSQQKLDQEMRRKSELKALQAQINPHFLYNTLDSIVWMAESGRNEEVVEMTAALAQLFRSSISESREMVPLSVEAANVSSYMTIQQMRYQEPIRFEADIPPELRGYLLPKLVLQPLVENAVNHGIRPRGGGGRITVSARQEQNRVIITVRDDGVGMGAHQLDEVLTAVPRKESGGIGVKNVHERIRLVYGEEYGLRFQSREGEGTLVSLILPKGGGAE